MIALPREKEGLLIVIAGEIVEAHINNMMIRWALLALSRASSRYAATKKLDLRVLINDSLRSHTINGRGALNFVRNLNFRLLGALRKFPNNWAKNFLNQNFSIKLSERRMTGGGERKMNFILSVNYNHRNLLRRFDYPKFFHL
jgi:hypothetical protein